MLGGGQLGRMLALAGYPVGLHFRFLDHAPQSSAADVGELIVAEFEDSAALDQFAEDLDVVTYEFENVPVSAVVHLAKRLPVYPPAEALIASQDRLTEKTFLRDLSIPTAQFAPVSSTAELDAAAATLGHPSILKTRLMGYDGKGQVRLIRKEDHPAALEAIGSTSAILEAVVPFERELSLLVARSVSGELAYYALTENHHEEGILRKSIAPAPGLAPALQQLSEQYGRAIVEKLNYVGVLAIEFFQLGDQLMVNEIAPRVHNSGHWTIEGAETSQFENHLRAILDLPLGSPRARGTSVMVNCIGEMPGMATCLRVQGLHYHSYGKASRPGRKVGHLTMCCATETAAREALQILEQTVAGAT